MGKTISVSVVIPRLPDPKYDAITESTIASYRKFAGAEIEVIVSAKNADFAINVNTGLKQASGQFLVISNNDIIALPGWYSWISAERSKLGIVSLTQRADCGWGYMIPRKLYELVGGLDENLENSYEDYDLFMRCALKGHSRILAPRPFAVHQGGTTLNDVWGRMENASNKRIETCRKNLAYMQRKWPNMDFDAAPTNYFAHNEIAIMQDWKQHNG